MLGRVLEDGIGLGQDDAVSVEESLVGLTVGETSTSDTNVLDETQVANLMARSLLVEESSTLFIIGFDATNVVRVALEKLLNQATQSGLQSKLDILGVLVVFRRSYSELRTSCLGSLLVLSLRGGHGEE